MGKAVTRQAFVICSGACFKPEDSDECCKAQAEKLKNIAKTRRALSAHRRVTL
jgi:hypothetical protein